MPVQKQKLNELFTPLGFSALDIDDDSGRYTRQLLRRQPTQRKMYGGDIGLMLNAHGQ